jgi:hypothetical protein
MDTSTSTEPSIQSPKKSSEIFRVLKRILILFFVLIILLAGSVFVIGFYYQDQVKEYVISELNKQLNTAIIVDAKDIDFTVIRNFPYASVDFKNIKALDAVQSKHKDTLFKAGRISFQFNIKDIFNKNYHIKKVEIDNVDLKIKIDKNGKDNYHFWKESADTSSTAFSFALEKIVLKQVHVLYKDLQSKQNIDVLINRSNLTGAFSNDNYSLETASDLFVNHIRTDDVNYLQKKNVHAEVALNVDNKTSSYKIKDTKIKIENLLFEVVGNIITANDQSIINLGIKGKEMDIKSVLSLIPENYKNKINDYESDGEFYFTSTIQGSWSGDQSPEIEADFGIKNADITQVKDNVVLHNVNLKGHYFNGTKNEPSILTLIPFTATIDQGSIAGELSLKNLTNPSFKGKIKADISLEKLQRFIKIDTIESVSGQLKIDASYSGEEKNISSGNYENVSTSGNLWISNMNVKLKNDILEFGKINGDFTFDNNDLIVNDLSGTASSSDFNLKGSFKNLMGFILKEKEDITVDAKLHSNYINLNEILANKDENASSDSKYKLKFSEYIDVILNSEIERLEFRKFNASNIRGVIKLQDKKMVVDPITFSTMSGNITTSGLVDGSDSTQLLVTCFSEASKINITQLFQQFENFGATAITDKNIKGVAGFKVQFASVLSPELDMDMDKLYAGIDMTIENGELNNVEAMKSMSRFIELKELENIRFATLKNQIEVKHQQLTIPKMEIKSNALTIMLSGTHSFENVINYKIKLSLNELLSKKAKQAKKQNEEFGEVADDGLGRTNIFLSMTGTVDEPVIKYDSKSAIQNVKQDLKVEKQTLKGILKDEFGLFKKDSTLNNKTPKDDTKFNIKWNEDEKKDAPKELKKPKKKEEDDF